MGHDPADEEHDALAALFAAHRPRLRTLAERLLGSAVEAEDAVQDAWLRLARTDVDEIDNLGGWLTTVTARLCVDRLRTRRARPEVPLGTLELDVPSAEDPARDAARADSVGRALVVVLESLSPAERVALVLHDVFAIPFQEIAPILDRSVEATRKLGARARHRARIGAENSDPDLAGRRAVILRFLNAIREGDSGAMLAILAPDATRHVDAALLAPGQPAVVTGARTIVEEARSFSAPARRARPLLVDGELGAVVERDGHPVLAITFVIARNVIRRFDVIADPDHLGRLTITPPRGPDGTGPS